MLQVHKSVAHGTFVWYTQVSVSIIKIVRGRKSKLFPVIFKIHDMYMTSDVETMRQIIWLRWGHETCHKAIFFNIALYIYVLERVAPRANCQTNSSGMNGNIVIIFVKKISTGLPGDYDI